MKARSKWLGIIVAAAAVAASLALIEAARSWPLWLATWGQDARRRAEPSASPGCFAVSLNWRSPTHVTVVGAASSVGLAGWRGPRAARAEVLLDTGLSLPLLTADGAGLLGSEVAQRLAVEIHGFAGQKVTVVPLEESERLQLTLSATTGAGPIVTPVWHYVSDSLHGVHVIAPPTALAPVGGAVRLDLVRSRLVVCEMLEGCLDGTGWTRLAREACSTNPELVAIDAVVNTRPARFMLDTGGSTLLFSEFYAKARLSERETRRSSGQLIGAGDSTIEANRVAGQYKILLGVDQPVMRPAPHLWVARARKRAGPTACFPDGAIGLDLLRGCELVLSEATPRRGYLRCR
jgi:hypothetical protein